MTPVFKVPEENLINVAQLKSKAKPLGECLKIGSKGNCGRKDLDPNWDAAF